MTDLPFYQILPPPHTKTLLILVMYLFLDLPLQTSALEEEVKNAIPQTICIKTTKHYMYIMYNVYLQY